MTENVDERSVGDILNADIAAAETQAREIRASSARLLASEQVQMIASASLIARAERNFAQFALLCEVAARRMRQFADQLGIEPPNPATLPNNLIVRTVRTTEEHLATCIRGCPEGTRMADQLEPGYTEVSPQKVVDIAANLASLNEMMSALVSGLAAGETVDDTWSRLAFETLREHNWQLGFTFNEERPPAEWHEADTARRLRKQ